MPIYEYVCATCEYKFDKLQSMSSVGADCLRCGQPARRAISLFSAVTTGDDGELSYIPSMGGGCPSCAGGGCACAAH
jgi:putative FmdB family regulatory protein